VRKVIKPLLMRQTNSVHPYSRLAHLPKTFWEQPLKISGANAERYTLSIAKSFI
jgi:hypothetical protein